MNDDRLIVTEHRAGRPVLLALLSVPVTCFAGTLATDITYASTANMMWADFSAWLLAAAMVGSVLALIVRGIGLAIEGRGRRARPAWPAVGGAVVVLVLGFLDNLVHSRDGWTSVVPAGLSLSVLTVLAMLVTGWLGSAPVRS